MAFSEVFDIEGGGGHAHAMGDDRPETETYLVRPVHSDVANARDKWLYIFRADIHPGRTISASSLQWEGQYDDQGGLKVVDWSQGAGQWAGQDVRPATIDKPNGVITLTIEDRSALGRPLEGVRSVHVAFLSHAQLPAVRLDQYFSGHPDARLPSRALLLDPGATAEDGGFRSTLAHAASTTRWMLAPDADGVCWAYLFDYVDFARTLHGYYAASVARFAAYSLDNAEKILHAGLTRSLADAYRDEEHKDDDERDDVPDPDWTLAEEVSSQGRVPGEVYTRLDAFAAEVAAEAARVEFWATHLYDEWMSGDAFAMAREDATGFGPLDGLADPALDAVEAEIARQADLLDGAEVSERGKAYLAANLARANTPPWYDRVALATRIVGRLADIPKTYYESLAAKATEEIAAATADLKARRLSAFAQLLTSYEHARIVVPSAATAIDEKQLRILTPMLTAVGPGAPGSGGLPGSPADLLSSLPTPLRGATGSGLTALPTAMIVGATGRGVQGAGLNLLEPTHWTPGHTYGLRDAPTTQFRWTRTEDGLLVLSGGGRRAFADARGLLTGAPGLVTPSGEPLTRKRAALSRLVDVTGRPLAESDAAAFDAFRQRVASEQAALDARQLAVDMREARLNWAGRLFIALNLLDLITSWADLQAKIRDGRRDQGRGAGAWEAYLGAMGAGAGTASAATGLIESTKALLPKGIAAGRVGLALTVFGKISGVLAIVSSSVSLVQEIDTHDEAGAWSAGFGLAAGMFVFIYPPAAVALAVISVVIFLFANTPIEDWLENNYWGVEETGEIRALSSSRGRRRLIYEVEDLFGMLGRPLLSVEVRRSEAGAPSELVRYGSTLETAAPNRLRLTIRPGLFPDGATIEVSLFEILLPPRGLGDMISGDREATSIQDRLSVPDPLREAVAEGAHGGTVFIREWGLDDLPGSLAQRLRMPPTVLTFTCRVTVRLPQGFSRVTSPAYTVRGAVGYARDYGTMVSVGSAQPAGR